MNKPSSQLVEISSVLIRDYIRANIVAALTDVRNDRADNKVTTDPPQDYFFFPTSQAFRCPAVFIITDEIDFRVEEMGANFVNATINFKISVVIEDRAEEYLTTKAWRYQAALFKLLNQNSLLDGSQSVKVTTVVQRATYSSTFTNSGVSPQVFRKEVLLEVDAYHYEQF